MENRIDLTKLCRSCGEGLLDSSRFCDRCGAAQPTRSSQPEPHLHPDEPVPETELDDLTGLCKSCGEELHGSPRFCDRCGAAQPTQSPQPKSHLRTTESVPRTELESLRASLVAKIGDLESKLAESVPRQEVDTLYVKLRQVESLLAVSIPRREAKAEADSLRAKIAQLQDRLAGSVPKTELEAKVNELETARKTIEDLGWKLLRSSATVEDLQSKLSDSVPKIELEAVKRQLESKIVNLEANLAFSIPGREAKELVTGAPVALRPVQTSLYKASASKCPFCKYRNRPDAVYCASCGHNLKDEKARLKLIEQSPIEHSSPITTAKRTRIGGLSKLKSLLGSGSKSQKNITPHTPSAQPEDMLETELTKLKSLYESGALTETEYQRKKNKLLSDR